MRTRLIGYWTSTAVLVFVLVSGGLGELTQQWGTIETVQVLGYPLYVLTILGAWKIVGGLVLLVPGVARLKEWVVAGVVFNMTGAAASHAFSNDSGVFGFHIIVPLCIAGLALLSLALRPATANGSAGQRSHARVVHVLGEQVA